MCSVDDGAPLVHASASEAAADADPMLGQVLAGRFTVRSRLGSGSMGTVYRATQAPIGREVALKILRTDRAVDDASRARFLREARANSALTSPNTVTVFDFGQSENGEFYLAMELLEGESVGERIRRLGRLGVADSLEVAQQALRSLAEAHAKGIIHRDLKPDNLFFARVPAVEEEHASGPHEVVKVLDFGVAKMLRDDGDGAMDAVETQAGTVFGTPRYMSPEQAQGKPLDARTDIYSLGVILYHMLTGSPPFTDDDAIVVMARHIKSNPVPLREAAPYAPSISAEVEAIVMRALSKEPDARPASAEEMLAELRYVAEQVASRASGVRSSVAPPEGAPARGRAAEDTWRGPSLAPSGRRGRRWPLFAAAGVGVGVVGALAFVFIGRVVESQSPAPAPLAASAASAARPAAPLVSPLPPPENVAADPSSTAASAAPPATPATPAASPTLLHVGQGSATGGSHPPRPAHPSAPAAVPSAKPAKKQVGYGYLE